MPVSVPERQFSRGAPTAGEASAVVTAIERSLKPVQSHTFEDVHFVSFGRVPAADVTVDYRFFQLSIPEKFFRQTAPQVFNTTTGARLDPKTRQIPVDAIVPLAPFPAGPYRLEIGVKDRLAGTSVTRQVIFTVE